MITLLGDLGYDIRIGKGKKYKFLGGSGFHSAVGAIIANGKPLLVSCVGSDFDMSRIIRCHIPNRFIKKSNRRKTSRFIIEGAEDTRNVRFNNWPFPVIHGIGNSKEITDSKIIHLTSANPVNQLVYINSIKKCGYSGLISVDVFDQHCANFPEDVLRILSLCDIVFMNQKEQMLLNYYDMDPKKIIIIKKGANGADCYAEGEKYSSRFTPKIVNDTIGAGDVLCGAFTSSIDNEMSVKASLDMAVAIATKSVEFFGNESFLQSMNNRIDFQTQ